MGIAWLPVTGDKRTWRLEGTVGVKNEPATVGGIIETKSIPFSFANLKASSSVASFDRTYTYISNNLKKKEFKVTKVSYSNFQNYKHQFESAIREYFSMNKSN